MTTAQATPAMVSGAKVHEFTTDLVVRRRHPAADGVVVLDLVDPQTDTLPAWEPGAHVDLMLEEGLVRQYSLCGDPTDGNVWRVGVLLDPHSRGGSRHVHENLAEGAFGAPATIFRSSTRRGICSSRAASESPPSCR
jgi:hypothetical protein